jgi:alcohol dehydrogenase (cytochrome c)
MSGNSCARRAGLLLAVANLALALAACGNNYPPLPVSEQSRSFQSLNAKLRGSAPPVAEQVTAERLVNARTEPQNWMTYYGAYDGQRYSALDQITAATIGNVKTAWVFQYGIIGLTPSPASYSFEGTPLVVDGVMYLTGADGYVWAIDAVTGQALWEYHHALPFDVALCCGNVNRGVAVARGKLFFVTANGHLIALNAATGQPLWDQLFLDVRAGESATLAPLVIKDKVLVGSSGAEYGVRGHIDSFDAETGGHVWRFYPVPKPGERGAESWAGDAWARGGGTAWITGSYDPELNLTYWGTGNPAPDFDGDARPGDNLYTSSIVALDPDTGALRWYYQMTPHDLWDYDGVNENILFDSGGRKLLAHFDKNGYLFVLDRTDGRLMNATPFATVTWGEVDAHSGKITVRKVPTVAGERICPGPAGAKEWPHAAYSEETKLLYAPVVEQCATYRTFRTEFRESLPYWGGETKPDANEHAGYIKAFDPTTGKQAWSWRTEHPVLGSILATGGGLIFAGLATGEFIALDARSGKMLWQFQTGSGIHGSPITYRVDGRQYIAVPSGWGGWMKGYAPELYGASRGNALFVFALP